MGQPVEIENYLYGLYQSLSGMKFPISVIRLVTDVPPEVNESQLSRRLTGTDQEVWVVLSDEDIPLLELYGILPLLGAIFLYWLAYQYKLVGCTKTAKQDLIDEEVLTWLQINLKDKKLVNLTNQKTVDVANKPLCFFSALIDFCQQNPELHINPNKELPEELISLSNKYFFRLIDLGHTIRKRPNFTNNLEKTLSEIRAALDEIFDKDVE